MWELSFTSFGLNNERKGDAVNKLALLEPSIKLSIVTIGGSKEEEGTFGPGVAALCRGVREYGSLNAAAKNMRMAYSKAWRIMGESERLLGVQLIARDGARGSRLTEDGEKLLDTYDALKEQLRKHACLLYAEATAAEEQSLGE